MAPLAVDSVGRIRPPRVVVGSVSFDPLTLATATAFVRDALGRGAGGMLIVVDADEHRRGRGSALTDATVVLTNSAAAVLASRVAGHGLPERVPAMALAESLCSVAASDARRVYVIGGAPGGRGVPSGAQRAAAVLGLRFRGLRIAGCASPPPGLDANRPGCAAIVADVVDAKPDLVLIGTTAAMAEELLTALRPELPGAWLFGCPGLVDTTLGGEVSRRRTPMVVVHAARLLARAIAHRVTGWLRRQ